VVNAIIMMSAIATNDKNDCLPFHLSDNPIRFEPLSAATTVAIFFDESNRQVLYLK